MGIITIVIRHNTNMLILYFVVPKQEKTQYLKNDTHAWGTVANVRFGRSQFAVGHLGLRPFFSDYVTFRYQTTAVIIPECGGG